VVITTKLKYGNKDLNNGDKVSGEAAVLPEEKFFIALFLI